MPLNIVQIPCTDGCVYIYNLDTKKAQKLCDLASPAEYPDEVKQIINTLQRLTVREGK